MNRIFIPDEEKNLDTAFGEKYLDYKRKSGDGYDI